jgi:hypothetical protein
MRTLGAALCAILLSAWSAGAVGTATCVSIADFIPGGGAIVGYEHVAQCTTSAAYAAGGDQFGNVGRDLCGSSDRLVKWVQVEAVKANGASTAVAFDFIPSTSKLQCFLTGAVVSTAFAECTTQGQSLVVNVIAFCQ